MNLNKYLFAVVLLMFMTSCSHKTWQIVQRSTAKISIDSTKDAIADKNYENYLRPFKERIDTEMDVVIGQAAETMLGHAPESLLSNFCADVYLKAATEYLTKPVDFAVVNLGGLRTVVPAGDITVRKVFELMPFENELVIVWLKGSELNEFLQSFAENGVEGVSGVRMEIKGNEVININIHGETLKTENLYSVATNDYFASVNEKMQKFQKIQNTNIKIRDMLLNYIKAEAKKGHKIQSKLDGRIKNRLMDSKF
jgi:2',3'-cyclic-nucleotide 2'-phosphodiesterase (5'-nucleotidase family)